MKRGWTSFPITFLSPVPVAAAPGCLCGLHITRLMSLSLSDTQSSFGARRVNGDVSISLPSLYPEPSKCSGISWYLCVLVYIVVAGGLVMMSLSVSGTTPPTSFELTSGETRLLDINNVVYRSIELIDIAATVHTYVYQRSEPILLFQPINTTVPFSVPKDHYKYWARYLNEGSKVLLSLQWSGAPLKLCILRSELAVWLATNECLFTSRGQIEMTVSFTSAMASDYYFVLERDTEPSSAMPPIEGNRPFNSIDDDTTSDPTLQVLDPFGEAISPGEMTTGRKLNNVASLRQGTSLSRDMLELGTRNESPASRSDPSSWISRGTATFDMSLSQYNIKDADDYMIGSMYKEFSLGSLEKYVVYNPEGEHTIKVSYTLVSRSSSLALTVFLLQVMLGVFLWICYYKTRTKVPVADMMVITPYHMAVARTARLKRMAAVAKVANRPLNQPLAADKVAFAKSN